MCDIQMLGATRTKMKRQLEIAYMLLLGVFLPSVCFAAEPTTLVRFRCMPELQIVEVYEWTIEHTPWDTMYKNGQIDRDMLAKYDYYPWPIANAKCEMMKSKYSLEFLPGEAAYGLYADGRLLISGIFYEPSLGYNIKMYMINTTRDGGFKDLRVAYRRDYEFVSERYSSHCLPVKLREIDQAIRENTPQFSCLKD